MLVDLWPRVSTGLEIRSRCRRCLRSALASPLLADLDLAANGIPSGKKRLANSTLTNSDHRRCHSVRIQKAATPH